MHKIIIQGSEIIEQVASKAVLLHGGNGVIIENDVERFYHDAKVNAIGGGSVAFLMDLVSSML